jgi:hypothetical protein
VVVESIGEAFPLGWRARMRCSWELRNIMKRVRECDFRCELDLETLVCTCGTGMPAVAAARAPQMHAMRLPQGIADLRVAIRKGRAIG